ncbi:hypothetical protein QA612_15840 [Evansella sp. AB-P1]|uniref:hypothetical protein n=1 Tax=Evansella sp. AB-P1 TaxID=3037653 RepID=UPI00241BEE2E|nr:hypothetical protein [Evansella sp. AB-P1]MDG5788928.1 hypothetical protein [Evansella sp. AB-P1]
MYQLLSASVERIKNSTHINEILEKTELVVCFFCENEKWLVRFGNQTIEIESVFDHVGDVIIEGDLEAIRLLLKGEDFLLSMKNRGELEVNGGLRELLLLESLFYLTKDTNTPKK